MEQTLPKIAIVQKEDISNLQFPHTEVIRDKNGRKILQSSLSRAIILGNTQKRKVKIYYEDSEGMKMTETTIWAVTEKNIVLKKGVSIPIHRIHQISAY